ncbi:MAG TPA: hypothetical protein VIJ12_02560 [Candidatus Baltobacteraceae bacterium]
MRIDGSCAFLFHPHAVMRHLGHTGGVNLEWLREKLGDLEVAGLEIEWKDHTVATSIVRKHAWKKDGTQYAVVLESEYMQFFVSDIRVHSERLTSEILALENATTKALVRFVLTHRSWNRSLDDTLTAIGYVGGDRNRRRAKDKIASEADVLARDFGVVIKDGAIRYEQHGKVWFETPPALNADVS